MPDIVEFAENERDIETLKQDTMSESLSAFNDGEMFNHNLSTIDAVFNPEQPDRPIITRTKVKMRPHDTQVPEWTIDFLSLEQQDALDDFLIRNRLDETASPFVDQPDDDLVERPKSNVDALNDRYVFSPRATELFDNTGVDLELIADDIKMSQSVPLFGLEKGLRGGIDDVENRKLDVFSTKDSFRAKAVEVAERLGANRHRVVETFRDKAPDVIMEYLQQMAERSVNGEAQAIDVIEKMNELEIMHRELKFQTDDTLDTSIDVFSETLSTPDYSFPSRVSGPDDVMNQYGIGGLDYLRL